MTNRDIFKAFGGISEDIIEEAGTETEAQRKSKKRRVVASAAALAACAALALVLWNPSGTAGGHTAQDGTQPPAESSSDASPDNGVFEPAPPYEGVYIPPDPMPEAPSAEQGVAADMVAFFIHGGRLYTQTGQYADPSLKDGYICSVTGDIDEWSGADEYVEGASSIGGDVYSVRGYDTDFRLCMDGPDGKIEFYDCLSDVTLYSGADLFGELLHIESYVGAYYVLDADWEENIDARHELDTESLEAFVSLLLASPMQEWSVWSENGDIFDYEYAEAHLCFELADGTTVPLRLFENGCVKYDGSALRVCAYMPGAIFDAVFDACT